MRSGHAGWSLRTSRARGAGDPCAVLPYMPVACCTLAATSQLSAAVACHHVRHSCLTRLLATRVVGRWLWKTGSSCNDDNNIGRPTKKFVMSEFQKVVDAFQAKGWVKIRCTEPPETFISCFDFQLAGSPPGPAPPAPPTPPSPPPPPKDPMCCWSNWGDDTKCGNWVGPGAQCNTDLTKKCTGNQDCPKSGLVLALE